MLELEKKRKLPPHIFKKKSKIRGGVIFAPSAKHGKAPKKILGAAWPRPVSDELL